MIADSGDCRFGGTVGPTALGVLGRRSRATPGVGSELSSSSSGSLARAVIVRARCRDGPTTRGEGLALTTPEVAPEDRVAGLVGAATTLARTVGSVKASASVGGTVPSLAFSGSGSEGRAGNETLPVFGRSRSAATPETRTPPTIAVAASAARTVNLFMTVESTLPL